MTVTAVAPRTVGVEVGTMFSRSWGYDQTNVDYYRVVGLTPKGVKIQKWSSAAVDDGHVTAGDGPARQNVWPKVEQAELAACDECVRFHEANYGALPANGVPYGASRFCDDHGPRTEDCPVETKRLQSYGGDSVYVAVGSYNDHAYKWDGRPDYETPAGMGH